LHESGTYVRLWAALVYLLPLDPPWLEVAQILSSWLSKLSTGLMTLRIISSYCWATLARRIIHRNSLGRRHIMDRIQSGFVVTAITGFFVLLGAMAMLMIA